MLENAMVRPRVFSEDSADVPWLTAKIIDGERYQAILGASHDAYDDDEGYDDDGSVDSWEGDEEGTVRSHRSQSARKSHYRPRLAMVVVPSFIFFMSIFILIPAGVQLQLAMVCGVTQGGVDCDSAEVSASTARMTLVTQLAQSVPAFLLSGFYSSVANRYGRRLCLIIPLLGPALYASVLLLLLYASEAGMVMSYNDITVYTTVGSLCLGLSGSFSTFQMASFSYAADITTKNLAKRGLIYTLLEASLFMGKTVGPISAGMYAQRFGFKGPLMFVVSTCLLGVLWCTLVVKEEDKFPKLENRLNFNPLHTFRNIGLLWGKTVEAERRIAAARQTYDPLAYVEEEKEDRQKNNEDDENGSEGEAAGVGCSIACTGSPMPYVAAACYFYFCAFSGNQNVWYLFITHSMGWGPSLIGAYDAYEGFFQFLSMTLVPWLIMKVFKRYVDIYWLLIGYTARAAHYVLLGTASSTANIFAIAPLLLFGAILAPRSRSIVSQCVDMEEQADVLSGFSAMQGSAQFLAPVMAFGYTLSVYSAPYTIYLVFGGLCAAGAVCILAVLGTPAIKGRLPATPSVNDMGGKKQANAKMDYSPLITSDDLNDKDAPLVEKTM